MSECCGNCRFWHRLHGERGERGDGYCRRYPPSFPMSYMRVGGHMVLGNDYKNDGWPNVADSSWCGEYAPLPSPPETK